MPSVRGGPAQKARRDMRGLEECLTFEDLVADYIRECEVRGAQATPVLPRVVIGITRLAIRAFRAPPRRVLPTVVQKSD